MLRKLLLVVCMPLLLFAAMPLLLSGLEDEYLLDFGNYEPRIFEEFPNITDNRDPLRYADGRPQLSLTTNDLALNNWRVRLQSSGKHNRHIVNSMCRKVYSNERESDVLGVRVHFPHTRQNDRAIIEPLFSFNAYDTNGQFANINNGVLANVGVIKEVSIWVKGRNYPYDLAVRVWDERHEMREFFFGHLAFDNWRRLTWVNPNYIPNITDRILMRQPLYPQDLPYIRFKNIVVYRQMDQIGGDFVVYFKDIQMQYEKFAPEVYDGDIDDEEEWNIIRERTTRRMHIEHSRLAELLDVYRREMRRLGVFDNEQDQD